jgi:hypothetical protein
MAPWSAGCEHRAEAQREASPPALVEAPASPSAQSQAVELVNPPVTVAPAAAREPIDTQAGASEQAGPRVHAKTRFVWIRQAPDADTQWIGYLWSGESAPLVTGKPVYGPGCNTWYAIEPLGYVCVDGNRATLDADDPGFVEARKYAADLGSAWPHRYGEAPRGLTRLLDVAGSPLALTALPKSVQDSRVTLRHGSSVAYTRELRIGEQDFLLGSDLSLIPRAKVTLFPRWEFRGVELGRDAELPLAFFRTKDRPRYRRVAEGFEPTGQMFPRLSHVALTGKSENWSGERYLETKAGEYVRADDAVVPVPSSKPPWGDAPTKGRGTWIEVSVTRGWLLAYEGTRPVFATLMAPGKGGPSVLDRDPVKEARTPLGTFPISGKFATATMVAPDELVHMAVPWTQNFSGPHALHGAYWHDDWGTYRSGGCINLSPLDAKRIFDWTDPKLPEGWHGVRWLPWRGPATILVVRR